jgi:hypothetical protein
MTVRDALPQFIQIGVFRYRLQHWDPKVICVRTDIDDTTFAETLEHEIGHACWFACALKSRANEETVISRFTPFLMMARRDNQEIYAWIDSVLRKPTQ